jgi:hypothetical protein
MSRLFILPPTSMMRPASMTSATATWGEGGKSENQRCAVGVDDEHAEMAAGG